MRTAVRRINLGAPHAEIPFPTARQVRARASIDREAESSPVRWIAVQVVAAAPVPALWIGAGAAQEATASGIEASLHLPAIEAAARSAALRVVQAAAPLGPAAAGALPVLEAVLAGVVEAAVVAADGGK